MHIGHQAIQAMAVICLFCMPRFIVSGGDPLSPPLSKQRWFFNEWAAIELPRRAATQARMSRAPYTHVRGDSVRIGGQKNEMR